MKKISLILILFLLLTACSDTPDKSSQGKISITDDLGNNIILNKIPQKVISLAPNLTEIVYSLDAGDKLVGNTKYCNYPAEANNVEKIGDLLTVDYEKIIRIKPDLILQTIEGNKKEVYDKLVSLGFNVFISNPRDFDGIKKTMKDVSVLLNKKALADSMIQDWNKQYIEITSDELFEEKNAVFLVSVTPIMVAGENTFLNTFLKSLGIKNIAEGININYPVFSREEILIKNPDFILYPDMGGGDIDNIKDAYPEWKDLKAFRNNHIVFLNADLYYRPGPRYIKALNDLKLKLKELFR